MKILCSEDFDEFVDSLRDIDSFMLLRNVKRRIWSNCYLNFGGLHIQLGKLGSGNIAEGLSSKSGYMIYLPLTERALYTANGCPLGVASFAVLEPGCEFSISTEDEHDWCTVFVPTDRFDQSVCSSHSEKKRCRVTSAMPEQARRIKTLTLKVLAAAKEYPKIETSPAAATIATEFLRLSGAIVSEQPPVNEGNLGGRPLIPRDEVIRRAKQIIAGPAGRQPQTDELAATLGVSERTLRNVFREYYGIGPSRYMQLKQLQKVRNELRAAEVEQTRVSDVLVQNGVWEFGRFASLYRRHFGELPSDTLRTKAR